MRQSIGEDSQSFLCRSAFSGTADAEMWLSPLSSGCYRKDTSDSQLWGCLGGCSVTSTSVWGWSGSTSPAVLRAVTVALTPTPAQGSWTAWERILEPWEYLHRNLILTGSLGDPMEQHGSENNTTCESSSFYKGGFLLRACFEIDEVCQALLFFASLPSMTEQSWSKPSTGPAMVGLSLLSAAAGLWL